MNLLKSASHYYCYFKDPQRVVLIVMVARVKLIRILIVILLFCLILLTLQNRQVSRQLPGLVFQRKFKLLRPEKQKFHHVTSRL